MSSLRGATDPFLDSLRTEATRDAYARSLKLFNAWCETNVDRLRFHDNQQKIIDYLRDLKARGFSYSKRHGCLAALKHYYSMNDIVLNWHKISKFQGEKTVENELRGYTHEEIKKMADIANIRYKAIILMLASTGMRRAAVTEIRMKHLKYVEEYKLYRIKIYPKTTAEQIVFTTPEAAKAIDIFLNYRREHDLTRLEPETRFHGTVPVAISFYLRHLCFKSGLSHNKPETEVTIHGQNRREIPAVHGLRKFAATQMGRSDMKVEHREILLGHSIGVRAAYQHYSEEDLLQEYLKAVDLLTINEENRLRRKVESLEEKESYIHKLMERMKDVERQLEALNGR